MPKVSKYLKMFWIGLNLEETGAGSQAHETPELKDMSRAVA